MWKNLLICVLVRQSMKTGRFHTLCWRTQKHRIVSNQLQIQKPANYQKNQGKQTLFKHNCHTENWYTKPLSAFGTSSGQNLATIFSSHACTKTMNMFALDVAGIKRSFHYGTPVESWNRINMIVQNCMAQSCTNSTAWNTALQDVKQVKQARSI